MESASAWPFEYSKLGIVEIYPHNLGDRQRLEHLGIEELLGVGKFTRTEQKPIAATNTDTRTLIESGC